MRTRLLCVVRLSVFLHIGCSAVDSLDGDELFDPDADMSGEALVAAPACDGDGPCSGTSQSRPQCAAAVRTGSFGWSSDQRFNVPTTRTYSAVTVVARRLFQDANGELVAEIRELAGGIASIDAAPVVATARLAGSLVSRTNGPLKLRFASPVSLSPAVGLSPRYALVLRVGAGRLAVGLGCANDPNAYEGGDAGLRKFQVAAGGAVTNGAWRALARDLSFALGTSSVPAGPCTVQAGATCDDGNATSGDGCSAACVPEAGFTCSGVPSTCTSSLPYSDVALGAASLVELAKVTTAYDAPWGWGGVQLDASRSLMMGGTGPFLFDGSTLAVTALDTPRFDNWAGGNPFTMGSNTLRIGSQFFFTPSNGHELFVFDGARPVSIAADAAGALCVNGSANPCSLGGLSYGVTLGSAYAVNGTTFISAPNLTQTAVDAVSLFIYDATRPVATIAGVLNAQGLSVNAVAPPIFQPCSGVANPCYLKLPSGTEFAAMYRTLLLADGAAYVLTRHCTTARLLWTAPGSSSGLSSGCGTSQVDVTRVVLATGATSVVGSMPWPTASALGFRSVEGRHFLATGEIVDGKNEYTNREITSLSPFTVASAPTPIVGSALTYQPANATVGPDVPWADELVLGTSTYFLQADTNVNARLVRRTGAATEAVAFNTLAGDSWILDMKRAGTGALLKSTFRVLGGDFTGARNESQRTATLWLLRPGASLAASATPSCEAGVANPCLLAFPGGDVLASQLDEVVVEADGSLVIAGQRGAYGTEGWQWWDVRRARAGVFRFGPDGRFVREYVLEPATPVTNPDTCLVGRYDAASPADNAFSVVWVDVGEAPIRSQAECEARAANAFGTPSEGYFARYAPDEPVWARFNPGHVARVDADHYVAVSDGLFWVPVAGSLPFNVNPVGPPSLVSIPASADAFSQTLGRVVRRFDR